MVSVVSVVSVNSVELQFVVCRKKHQNTKISFPEGTPIQSVYLKNKIKYPPSLFYIQSFQLFLYILYTKKIEKNNLLETHVFNKDYP